MRILGYILIVVGILDIATSYFLPYGSPIDPIVGPTIAPYTSFIFLGIGYFLKDVGKNSQDEDK